MTPDNVYRVRKAISVLEAALSWLAPTDLYAHTQITEALNALRMIDVGEEKPA